MFKPQLTIVGVLLAALLCSSSLVAGPAAPGIVADKMAKGAPAELAHWAKLIGRWSIADESLRADGSGWDPSPGADWDFYWAYEGWGIIDYYTSPPQSEAVKDESKRQRGINLRIYDPATKQWVMTWLTPSSTKPWNFVASSDSERIVMRDESPSPQGNYSRITFFDITDETFKWKMEWSTDQESWREVYRIHGTRKP